MNFKTLIRMAKQKNPTYVDFFKKKSIEFTKGNKKKYTTKNGRTRRLNELKKIREIVRKAVEGKERDRSNIPDLTMFFFTPITSFNALSESEKEMVISFANAYFFGDVNACIKEINRQLKEKEQGD